MADTLDQPDVAVSLSGKTAAEPFWSTPDLTGEHYRNVLQRFHRAFKPSNYLEIGVLDGVTLDFATCASIAIDPKFRIEKLSLNTKPSCAFYTMTSDAFFEAHSPSAIFGKPIDMAFLDGMHWFEFLLRDFINVERHCKQNSIVFLHDCLPTDEHVARRDADDGAKKERSSHPAWWAGDVWKVADILARYRPDLKMLAFDAGPTGLVAITSLNPSSTILSAGYFNLIEEYKNKTLVEYGDEYHQHLNVVTTQRSTSLIALSSLFWL